MSQQKHLLVNLSTWLLINTKDQRQIDIKLFVLPIVQFMIIQYKKL